MHTSLQARGFEGVLLFTNSAGDSGNDMMSEVPTDIPCTLGHMHIATNMYCIANSMYDHNYCIMTHAFN